MGYCDVCGVFSCCGGVYGGLDMQPFWISFHCSNNQQDSLVHAQLEQNLLTPLVIPVQEGNWGGLEQVLYHRGSSLLIDLEGMIHIAKICLMELERLLPLKLMLCENL
ncbi:unnamed protein product [Calypogeia fissa]